MLFRSAVSASASERLARQSKALEQVHADADHMATRISALEGEVAAKEAQLRAKAEGTMLEKAQAQVAQLTTDLAAAGAQAEIGGADPDPSALRDLLVSIALAGDADLVARAFEGGRVRGAVLRADGRFQTDVAGEIAEIADLEVLATPDHPVTYTLVPRGSGIRIGIDRDLDGLLDDDELRACSDPADPGSTPDEASCGPDLDGDGQVDGNDLGLLFSAWGPCPGGPCQADLSGNGTVGPEDLGILLAAWGG